MGFNLDAGLDIRAVHEAVKIGKTAEAAGTSAVDDPLYRVRDHRAVLAGVPELLRERTEKRLALLLGKRLKFTVSDFIATLNYHSHVEADDYGHSLTPPRQICRT